MAEFNESEHPRDKNGKFTDKGNGQEWTKEKKDRLLIALSFFSSKRKQIENNTENKEYTPPKEVYGFGDKNLLTSPDHLDHMRKMGFKNPKEYQRAAIDFWNSGDGIVCFGGLRKRFYKYNTQNNRMIVVSDDGIIHTFYTVGEKKFKKISAQERLQRWKK